MAGGLSFPVPSTTATADPLAPAACSVIFSSRAHLGEHKHMVHLLQRIDACPKVYQLDDVEAGGEWEVSRAPHRSSWDRTGADQRAASMQAHLREAYGAGLPVLFAHEELVGGEQSHIYSLGYTATGLSAVD